MSLTSNIEEKLGIKIDDLNAIEKETYFKMLEEVEKSEITPQRLKDYVASMREAVAEEIANEPTFIRILIFKVENPNLIRLQARLKNYMLLEAFLTSHKRAKEQLESMIANIK